MSRRLIAIWINRLMRLRYCTLICCTGFVRLSHAEISEVSLLADSEDQAYVFDTRMFRGSNLNQDKLKKITEHGVLTGHYKVDVYLNQQFLDKTEVEFAEFDQKVLACFSPKQIEDWGILPEKDLSLTIEPCSPLKDIVSAGQLRFDQSKLRLDLTLPQTALKQIPRGYVSPHLWNAGESIGFINYLANYYHSEFNDQSNDNAYLSFNGGVNFGKWQFRQQSNLNIQENSQDFEIIRSYFKRPIAQVSSELSLGELYSSGLFFSGIAYQGLNLKSDERMLPDSQRGYAPVVQGIAQTMARVSIEQNGREIYQTTVAPGPFKITDLYPTSYNGDLDVIIYEADGQQSRFRVPFSAVPESVRAGKVKYSLDVGKTRDIGEDSYFGNITTQYGLNNAITLNSGLRVADGYQAAVLGTALNHHIGAFGLDVTYSHADIPNQNALDGWMYGLSYSKHFSPTSTSLSLANYRYSTEGYRDLGEVLALRHQDEFNPSTNHYGSQKSRLTASLTQNLGKYGSLSFSGSSQEYYEDRDEDYQLQLSYGKSFSNGAQLSLNAVRQTYSQNSSSSLDLENKEEITDTIYGLSLNFPLFKNKPLAPQVSIGYQHTDEGENYQASVSGTADRENTMFYHVGTMYDQVSDQSSLNASLQKRWSNVNTNISASISDDSWQASANAQGAIALHRDGITFGPYLGDTFALVHAPGATGAKISNTPDAKLNKKGYALVPALSPYRFNSIAINPEGMADNVDLELGEQKVAPYAGATLRVKFDTRQGQALLIRSLDPEGHNLALGSDVFDENGNIVGVVGQNSQIYFRAEQLQGKLLVKWGNETSEQCSIHYDLSQSTDQQQLKRLESICQTGE